MTNGIDRPIFIVGCGRSGTTLLYQMLATHPDVGWISNYAERWPKVHSINAFSPLYRVATDSSRWRRLLPQPSEGQTAWDVIDGGNGSLDGGPLAAEAASETIRVRARAFVVALLRHQRRTRYLNKNTQNTGRVGYLDALFPDCFIVHIIRTPIAVVESMLRVDWWPTLRAWPFDGLTPREWKSAGGREEVMAATIWRRETELARCDGRALGERRYLELRYEDLVKDSGMTLREVADFAELPWSSRFEKRLRSFDVDLAAAQRPTSLRPDQIAAITSVVEPLSSQLGY